MNQLYIILFRRQLLSWVKKIDLENYQIISLTWELYLCYIEVQPVSFKTCVIENDTQLLQLLSEFCVWSSHHKVKFTKILKKKLLG